MHMLLEISRVRMMVVCPERMDSEVRGRPIAITRLISARIKKANGRCLRSQEILSSDESTKDKLE
jgi:hypothetical protein